MTFVVSDASFQTDVLDSKIPVMVDFWAPWCGPCRTIDPVIEKLSEIAGVEVKIMKSDIDDNPITATEYAIETIPTVILFRNGAIEKKLVGMQPERVYRELLGL
jgi:thioredoxin 1